MNLNCLMKMNLKMMTKNCLSLKMMMMKNCSSLKMKSLRTMMSCLMMKNLRTTKSCLMMRNWSRSWMMNLRKSLMSLRSLMNLKMNLRRNLMRMKKMMMMKSCLSLNRSYWNCCLKKRSSKKMSLN